MHFMQLAREQLWDENPHPISPLIPAGASSGLTGGLGNRVWGDYPRACRRYPSTRLNLFIALFCLGGNVSNFVRGSGCTVTI